MSVIMLEDEIYDQVAASLVHYIYWKKDLFMYPFSSMLQAKGIDEAEEIIRKEVSEWRRQNALSYDQRYNEDGEELEPMIFKTVQAVPMMQLYKWLQCIDYQIETNYKSLLLEKATHAAADKIIYDLKEYQDAKWAL